MSDIENRPPTSVLSSKPGLKDANIKPKDKIVKPKVKLSIVSFVPHWLTGEVEWFREKEAADAATFQQKPGPAGESFRWSMCAFHKMMTNTNLTHGASPCLHGWEHMSARRCHLTKQTNKKCCLLVASQLLILANSFQYFEHCSNLFDYPHLNIEQSVNWCHHPILLCKFVFQIQLSKHRLFPS